MADIRSSLRSIVSKFAWLSGFVSEEYGRASTAVQNEVGAIITDLIDNAMRPIIGQYIQKFGQKGFERIVDEDRDLLILIEKFVRAY